VLQRSPVGQQKYEVDYTSQVATILLTHAVIAVWKSSLMRAAIL
jgi:hypothetical protein